MTGSVEEPVTPVAGVELGWGLEEGQGTNTTRGSAAINLDDCSHRPGGR